MIKLVLLRHGESTWNKENLFTGWTDVDLSDHGKVEARQAGELLKAEGYTFDVAFTSVLKRAIRTLWIALDELDLMWIPVEHSWRLNERHYGALQGLNKAQTAAKYGDDQVLVWRRSYDEPPPALEKSDPRYPGTDPRYPRARPIGAPLDRMSQRHGRAFLPYWHDTVVPAIRAGKKVIITAHGNSLLRWSNTWTECPTRTLSGSTSPRVSRSSTSSIQSSIPFAIITWATPRPWPWQRRPLPTRARRSEAKPDQNSV